MFSGIMGVSGYEVEGIMKAKLEQLIDPNTRDVYATILAEKAQQTNVILSRICLFILSRWLLLGLFPDGDGVLLWIVAIISILPVWYLIVFALCIVEYVTHRIKSGSQGLKES